MSHLFSWPRCLGLTLLVALDAIRPGLAMNDPTRPSLPARRGAASQLAPSQSPAAQAAASAVAVAEPRLQSLHLPQQGPATALVDGQLLRVGDSLGPHTVTAIDAEGVSARGPAGRQRWTLLGVTYLDPAQARRAAARRQPAEVGTEAEPATAARAGASAHGLEPYIDTLPAGAPAAARWNGELPPVAPGLRRPAAPPAPPGGPAPHPSAGAGTTVWSAAPPTVAPPAPGAGAASRLAAWQPDPPGPSFTAAAGQPPSAAATEPRPGAAGAAAWADMIATPERLARLVQRRLGADADLARWQTLRDLPQLASSRLPHAQGAWVHTAMQPLPMGPAVLRLAVTERPWQAATPSGRAAVAAAQQALMSLTLNQLQGPVARPAALAWPAPADPARVPQPLLAQLPPQTLPQTPPQTPLQTPRQGPPGTPSRHQPDPLPVPLDLAALPPTAAGPMVRSRAAPIPTHPPLPSPPPRRAPQPALQLRMTLEPDPDPPSDRPVSAQTPAWVKESS